MDKKADQRCVFCEIVAGNAPAHRIYEDDLSLGILDINPFAEGHSLVIPKRHVPWWHDLTEEEDPQPENPGMAFYTPDGRFLLEFAGSGEYATVRQLIEDLYAQDVFGAGRLIESIRWELPTELEETARRWRDGRLRDAGVPGFDEAT